LLRKILPHFPTVIAFVSHHLFDATLLALTRGRLCLRQRFVNSAGVAVTGRWQPDRQQRVARQSDGWSLDIFIGD
jgi:hypothetical protein